jgi:hypothetical protein
MEYPVFQMGFFGNGFFIGIDAIIHVILSHGVAIGTIAMIGLAAYVGVRTNVPEFQKFGKNLLKPAVIVITGIGAVTGFGIWFITSALAPTGIGSLLRVFLWPWFIEWIVFTLEVITILIYYFVWDRWTGERVRYRYYYAFTYGILGTFSAVLITGIISFMLTSDGWPWDKDFWSAWYNPTFVPMSILRVSYGLALGALLASAFLLFTKWDDEFRRKALSVFGTVLAVCLPFVVGSAWWWFGAVPSSFKTHFIFAILTSHASQWPWIFWVLNGVGAAVILGFALTAVTRLVTPSKVLILFAVLWMMAFAAEYERIREFIRGPYLMPGYMYVNQILLKESDYLKETGLLENAYWFNMMVPEATDLQKGGFLFGQNCSMCHTIYGINSIMSRVYGRSEDGLAVIINHTNEMVPFMPPFSGTEEERRLLAKFLYKLYQEEIIITGYYRYTPLEGHKKNESVE